MARAAPGPSRSSRGPRGWALRQALALCEQQEIESVADLALLHAAGTLHEARAAPGTHVHAHATPRRNPPCARYTAGTPRGAASGRRVFLLYF